MLSIVKCTVLSVIKSTQVDAYLLSESSMFVYPHKMVLKTCGTTTLLNALPRILGIARQYCGFQKVWRVFYSRKNFMFPDKQQGPHKSWKQEVSFLNTHFDGGSAYKIGKVNNDHWYLYLTAPADDVLHHEESEDDFPPTPSGSDSESDSSPFGGSGYPQHDQTVEILMTKLNPKAMRQFYHHPDEEAGTIGGRRVDQQTGLDDIYPTASAQLDSYLFQPCGYSANGLWDGGYWTIHVTPEPTCSYASFETNIPVEISHSMAARGDGKINAKVAVKQTTPIQALIQQVTSVFQPDSFSVTLFSSHPREFTGRSRVRSDSGVGDLHSDLRRHPKDDGRYHHDHASMVKSMANIDGYKRTDRILYEFEGYDLMFGHYCSV
ncbi:adenosylmethionine decarboxylase [Jimgerdemannia flammicorona]|uniref:S-adenosylmethionine decarboxylase proenzyme n=1 Tax=Jimgerdemannia flammicorona TaxID=994334 RepID=A0A433Q636_9FUNG|nr:adenosylmethionine decarboxylase [Jimgerdemannia flammicorona]